MFCATVIITHIFLFRQFSFQCWIEDDDTASVTKISELFTSNKYIMYPNHQLLMVNIMLLFNFFFFFFNSNSIFYIIFFIFSFFDNNKNGTNEKKKNRKKNFHDQIFFIIS